MQKLSTIIQKKIKMLLRNIDKQRLYEIFSSMPISYEVLAYGSRVNGNAHSGSDLDLVIRNINQEPIPSELLFYIKEKIQDSNIPILVELRDWARLPESFKQNINKNHEVFFSNETISLNEPDVGYNK